MTQHTDEITDAIRQASGLEYYDHGHTNDGPYDSHDVVAAPANRTVEPRTPLVCVSWVAEEQEYAVFSGYAKEPSRPSHKGYDVTTIESTHDDLDNAIGSAVAVMDFILGNVGEDQEA